VSVLTSGQLLADRYRLARRIAVGGMGEVWEAADTRLDRPVAVKVLKPELCGDAEFLHRFRTEARTTASLNHPGIAGVHDYGETASIPDGPQDTAYLVMELVDGEPLAAVIARQHRLSPEFTLDILEQAGNALQAAHERGYVHRDVKPGNIMVATDQAGKHVMKLTDFGIAKAADAAPVTRSGIVMGTAHYIAPEQALGQEAEPASDVYSLAVVGYECLVGHRPFLSENAVTVAMMHIRDLPPPLPPDVPPGVRALVDATLVKDPRQRYRNGAEFAAAVVAVRAGLPLPAPSGLAPVGHPGLAVAGMPAAMPVMPVIPVQGPPPPLSPALGGTMPPSGPVPPPPSAHQQRSRLIHPLWLLVGVLVVLLVALGVWALTQRHGSPGTARPAGERQQQTTASTVAGADGLAHIGPVDTVSVHDNNYVGESADRATAQLHTLGLRTTLSTSAAGRADPAHCAVGSVTPTGDLPIGTAVTVACTAGGGTR
jgi:serine/threonine-protein kinase